MIHPNLPQMLEGHIATLDRAIIGMENTDRLGAKGIEELSAMREERQHCRALLRIWEAK